VKSGNFEVSGVGDKEADRDPWFLHLVRQYEVLKLSEDTFVPTRMTIPVWGDLNSWTEREMIIIYDT
jgi:hypothetical protein